MDKFDQIIIFSIVILMLLFWPLFMVANNYINATHGPLTSDDRLTLFCNSLAGSGLIHTSSDRDLLNSCFLYLSKDTNPSK